MKLCAPCVADIVNSPRFIRVWKDGIELNVGQYDLMGIVEELADDDGPGGFRFQWNTNEDVRLKAIIEIAGVPMCVRHVAGRNWQYPPSPLLYRGR